MHKIVIVDWLGAVVEDGVDIICLHGLLETLVDLKKLRHLGIRRTRNLLQRTGW